MQTGERKESYYFLYRDCAALEPTLVGDLEEKEDKCQIYFSITKQSVFYVLRPSNGKNSLELRFKTVPSPDTPHPVHPV